jgi:methionine sulfoxide reductase heme-binding subunit
MATAVGRHLFWITSRAAGTVALVTSSAAVCAGLLMSGRLTRRRIPDLRVIHEMLSLTTIAAIVLHGAALLGDSYLHPSVADVSIPFASSYKTLWTTMGIVAGWGIVLLGLSFYARARIGIERWRVLHRFTALAWVLGGVHSFGEGTDAGQAWFVVMTLAVVAPALKMLAFRWHEAAQARHPQTAE